MSLVVQEGPRAQPSRALSGERVTPTFDEVFRAFAPFAWRVLLRLGIAESDAEDVCQEVFVVVHRKLDDFEGRSALRTWIYGICVRAASDHRRRAHVRHETPTERLPDGALPPSQIEDVERRRALDLLEAMLARLDEDKRAVFVLYEIEGLTMPEIAEAIGCPLQTAYSRLHAARKLVEAAARASEEGGAR